MTTGVTRHYFTTRHQTSKTKTNTDFWSQTDVVLRSAVSDHITDSHSASEDTQELVTCMTACNERVRCWMGSSRLCLNPTQFNTSYKPFYQSDSSIWPCNAVFSVRPGSLDLSLSAHVSHITAVCFSASAAAFRPPLTMMLTL